MIFKYSNELFSSHSQPSASFSYPTECIRDLELTLPLPVYTYTLLIELHFPTDCFTDLGKLKLQIVVWI